MPPASSRWRKTIPCPVSRTAGDTALVRERLADAALPVGEVLFIGDLPQKHRRDREAAAAAVYASPLLNNLIESAQDEVLLQTPYLVLSKQAQAMFARMHERDPPPRVVVSTNSLAATDSFITYALSYKYKRRYLRDFGFEIHEFKPFPEDAPIDLEATGAVDISWNADGSVNIRAPEAPADILTTNTRKAAIQAATGLPYSKMTTDQRGMLLALLNEYAAAQPKAWSQAWRRGSAAAVAVSPLQPCRSTTRLASCRPEDWAAEPALEMGSPAQCPAASSPALPR